MCTPETTTDTTLCSHKRKAENTAASRCEPERKRARAEVDGNEPEKSPLDEWDMLQRKLDDVLVGRADRHLDDWERGWREICDQMDKQDRFKKDEKALLEDIGGLLKRCAFLESKLGIRD